MMSSQRVMQVFSLLCSNQMSLTLVFRGGWVLLWPGSNQATSPVPQAPCPVRKKENMKIDLITLIPKHNCVLVVFLNSRDFVAHEMGIEITALLPEISVPPSPATDQCQRNTQRFTLVINWLV